MDEKSVEPVQIVCFDVEAFVTIFPFFSNSGYIFRLPMISFLSKFILSKGKLRVCL